MLFSVNDIVRYHCQDASLRRLKRVSAQIQEFGICKDGDAPICLFRDRNSRIKFGFKPTALLYIEDVIYDLFDGYKPRSCTYRNLDNIVRRLERKLISLQIPPSERTGAIFHYQPPTGGRYYENPPVLYFVRGTNDWYLDFAYKRVQTLTTRGYLHLSHLQQSYAFSSLNT